VSAVFHDLDATLAAMLDAELAVDGVAVSFAAPDNQFPPTSIRPPAISLFLYDIRENTELRVGGWERQPAVGGEIGRRRPPSRVDCSYLVTAWASETAPDPAADEHRLLGAVLRVLLRHHTIPPGYLRGELVGHDPAVPARVAAQRQLPSLGEFWQAMGGKPKATLHYAVTLAVDASETVHMGPPVTAPVLRIETVATRPTITDPVPGGSAGSDSAQSRGASHA
jgi:Pvc16 N-terminal domain